MTSGHAMWLAIQGVVLVLGAYRVLRFLGWDDWPPVKKARAWLIGEHWVPIDPAPGVEKVAGTGRVDAPEIGLPGKQPWAMTGNVRPAYRRPLLAHLFRCPFCLGWWVSVVVAVAWMLEPRWTTYVMAPWALSGAIGLTAKVLDP